EPGCVDISRVPAPNEPGPHFAMGEDARESNRRVGEALVDDLVQLLGTKAEELLKEYAKLQPQHNPLTFDQVEEIWQKEIRPRLKDFASMQDGESAPAEDSRWYANWHVPSRG
ncbi:MAG: hypothetical protein ACE5PV_08240, partial [Candidatus Poribacteria bacterium]